MPLDPSSPKLCRATPSTPDLILAPIRGITDVVYRNVFTRCIGGLDRAMAPFVKLRNGHALTSSDRRQLAPEANDNLIVIPQVSTNHGIAFAEGLRELADMGYTEVNWNLGCPYPMVSKRQRGAGLLPHPKRIDSILTQVLNDCPVRLSVKMRLGFHSPDEFKAVIEVLNDHPLTEVILHPRTASQMYGGEVDLDRAVHACALCRHPFVYNGDVVSTESFQAVRTLFPMASGWMLGRGLLADPFLALRLKGESLTDEVRRHRLRQFHDRLLAEYSKVSSGDKQTLIKMREHWAYLSRGFDAPEVVHRRFKRCSDMEGYLIAVDRAFTQPWADDPPHIA